ncbi:hypothetical protein HN51_032303 [Arachis hypogaea]
MTNKPQGESKDAQRSNKGERGVFRSIKVYPLEPNDKNLIMNHLQIYLASCPWKIGQRNAGKESRRCCFCRRRETRAMDTPDGERDRQRVLSAPRSPPRLVVIIRAFHHHHGAIEHEEDRTAGQ